MSYKKKKIIIDTDIGADIDDAFALALAAQIEDAELIGVTTVFPNAPHRAQMSRKLLDTIGLRGTPVYMGEEEPMRAVKELPDREKLCDWLCQWGEECEGIDVWSGAVDFLIASAERYKDDLMIIPLGPMTNLGRAFEKAPESMKKIDCVLAMGGVFLRGGYEWNIFCDPVAVETVCASGVKIFAVGLEVTTRCPWHKIIDEFRGATDDTNRLLMLWYDRFYRKVGHAWGCEAYMHDIVAVAALRRGLCRFEKYYVKPEIEKPTERSFLVSEGKRDGYYPVFVAVDVDEAAFYDLLRSVMLQK